LCNVMTARANTRGLGLIEARGPKAPDDVGSVRFIHRSAKDFLETDADAVGFLGRTERHNQEQLLFDLLKANLLSNYLFAVAGYRDAFAELTRFYFWESLELFCVTGSLSRSRAADLVFLLHQAFRSLGRESFWESGLYNGNIEFVFLEHAASYSWTEVLQQAVTPAACEKDPIRRLSSPCLSYLLTRALTKNQLVSNYRWSEICNWLLSHGKVDPNLLQSSKIAVPCFLDPRKLPTLCSSFIKPLSLSWQICWPVGA